MFRDTGPQKPKEQKQSVEWAIWFQWVLASTLGWLLGWFLVGELGVGAVIGLAQWLVLRQAIDDRFGWWILASAGGWIVGWGLIVSGILISPESGITSIVTGSVIGLAVGLAQWFVLRRVVSRAGWWVLASTAAWILGLAGLLGGTLVGAVVGAVTGFMLDWLLRLQHQYRSD